MTPPSAKLCFELLELIFRQVCTSSPVDLYNATLVNKTWHSVAQSVIDKNIRLAIGSAKPGRFQKFVSRVRTDEDFRSRIRHLHVREWYQSGYLPSAKAPPARRTAGNLLHCPGYVVLDGFAYKRGRESSWKQMETLATTLALLQLCSFSWSAEPRIPNILLEALSAIPNCKVDIGFHQLARHVIMLPGIQTSSTLVSLHKAESSLRRLAVMVDAEDEKTVNQLGRVLTASRGLDTLQIRAYGQFDYCNEDATHLTNSMWLKVATNMFPRLAHLELSNVCACEDKDWKVWFSLIQWPYLRKAHFTCATFVVRGSPYMSGLRSLSLRMDDEKSPSWGTMCATPHNMDTVRSSLYGFDGLEELELRNATHVIDADLLAHLGKTIRRLLTRQLQPWDPITQYAQSVYLSDQILTTMGTVCPLLSDLTLDMPNDATDKLWNMLEIMAKSLTFVPHLHLHFSTPSIEVPGFPHTATRDSSDATCHKLWHYLSNHKGLPNCPFKSLQPDCHTSIPMPLRSLTISFGLDNEFIPSVGLGNFYNRTCHLTAGDSKTTCLNMSCPEEENARRYILEDGENTFFHDLELQHLTCLSQGRKEIMNGPFLTPRKRLQKRLLVERCKRGDVWKSVLDMSDGEVLDALPFRLPL